MEESFSDNLNKNTIILDTGRVIQEVRIRECLWNVQDELYNSKQTKQEAWQQVCEAVYPQYNSSSEVKKKIILKAVHLRWKTARDAYRKCKTPLKKTETSAESKKFKKNYLYENQLKFLNINDVQPTESLYQNQSNEPIIIEDPHNLLDDRSPSPEPLKKRKKDRSLTDFESELLSFVQNINTPTPTQGLLEDDQNFFNSLAPIINDYDADKKIIFRTSVLQLIKSIIDNGAQNTVTFEEVLLE